MKTIIWSVIAVGLLSGCSEGFPTSSRSQSGKATISVVTVEGCEYFHLPGYGLRYNLAHKGNCTNNIHIYKENR